MATAGRTFDGSVERNARHRAWILAIRPQTLPAGAAPVVVGTGVAVAEEVFALWPALAALLGALLIQIGTNLANDVYDAERGIDTDDRVGFTRVTSAGLLPGPVVKRGMWATFGTAVVIGGYLVWIGGLPIVVIGLVSIAAGITYAGGPIPFGSYGLGDLFVFVFFGLVAVCGTYYVQAAAVLSDPFPVWLPPETITPLAILASIPVACLTTAILVVNNYRDVETDAEAGKHSLAVLLGLRWTRVEFVGLITVAYAVPVGLAVGPIGVLILLPLITLPYAGLITRRMLTMPPGPVHNQTLGWTGKLLAGYALLFAVGVVLA